MNKRVFIFFYLFFYFEGSYNLLEMLYSNFFLCTFYAFNLYILASQICEE